MRIELNWIELFWMNMSFRTRYDKLLRRKIWSIFPLKTLMSKHSGCNCMYRIEWISFEDFQFISYLLTFLMSFWNVLWRQFNFTTHYYNFPSFPALGALRRWTPKLCISGVVSSSPSNEDALKSIYLWSYNHISCQSLPSSWAPKLKPDASTLV